MSHGIYQSQFLDIIIMQQTTEVTFSDIKKTLLVFKSNVYYVISDVTL